MNLVDKNVDTLLQFQAYIVHHKYNIDTTTWLSFDKDLWEHQLPHHTFATAISCGIGPVPSDHILILSSNNFKSIPNTLPHQIAHPGSPHLTLMYNEPTSYAPTHQVLHTPTSQHLKCFNIDTSLLLPHQTKIKQAHRATVMSLPAPLALQTNIANTTKTQPPTTMTQFKSHM